MKMSVKIAVAVYLVVMAGCVVAFFAQQSLVYGEHIVPGLQYSRSPVAVTLRDAQSGEVHYFTFVDDSVVADPLRMGNEIEEHLLSLMVANLATGVMLLFVVMTASKKAQPAG